MLLKLRLPRQLSKEGGELLKAFGLHPAFHLLALARHLNQTGSIELLDVVGKGRWGDTEPFAKFTNAVTYGPLGTTECASGAAGGEAMEQGEAVGIAQRLELFGILLE